VTDGLKPSTRKLLVSLHSRRDYEVTNRLHPVTGYRVFRRRRVRVLKDYQFLIKHPRTLIAVKKYAREWVDSILAEARRFENAFNTIWDI